MSTLAESLKRMQTIKPGMTRTDLLKVFTAEGGLSTGLQRTFGSQDCPYFKVDVEFEAVGGPTVYQHVGLASTRCEIRPLDRFLQLVIPLMNEKIIAGVGKEEYLYLNSPCPSPYPRALSSHYAHSFS